MATYVQTIFRPEQGGNKKPLFSVSLKGEYRNQVHEVWMFCEELEALKCFNTVTTDELEAIGMACLRVANFTRGWNDRHFDALYRRIYDA